MCGFDLGGGLIGSSIASRGVSGDGLLCSTSSAILVKLVWLEGSIGFSTIGTDQEIGFETGFCLRGLDRGRECLVEVVFCF